MIHSKIWGTFLSLISKQARHESRLVWTHPRWWALRRRMRKLTLEQTSVWRASGPACSAHPILAVVWSLVERVFLKQGTQSSQTSQATHAQDARQRGLTRSSSREVLSVLLLVWFNKTLCVFCFCCFCISEQCVVHFYCMKHLEVDMFLESGKLKI